MDKHDIINPEDQAPQLPADPAQAFAHMLPADPAQAFAHMLQAMNAMADMMRTTNERMGELERQVRLLEKVTPAQTSTLNAAIRDRAAVLCASYRADGQERAAARAIRREIRLTHGIRSMRELPRVEYAVAKERISLWDDYKTMKAIKEKGEGVMSKGKLTEWHCADCGHKETNYKMMDGLCCPKCGSSLWIARGKVGKGHSPAQSDGGAP